MIPTTNYAYSFCVYFFGCKNSKQFTEKEIEIKKGEIFQVNTVYTQLEVPGEKSEQTATYLTVQFAKKPTIEIDSLKFYYYRLAGLKVEPIVNSRNEIRLFLGGQEKSMSNPAMHVIDSVQFFYSREASAYVQTIREVLKKEPLYVP